jgi:hypothetical protein
LFRICLVHADAELSVVLHETPDDADLVAQWRAMATRLRLPRLAETGDGVFEAVDIRLGDLTLGPAATGRRRGAVAIRRRPRFLVRRRVGQRRLMRKIEGRSLFSSSR